VASINPELVRSLFLDEGMVAFFQGKATIRNPYAPGTVEYKAWRAGWLQALERRLVSNERPKTRRRTDA
jgi:hypothetical protein